MSQWRNHYTPCPRGVVHRMTPRIDRIRALLDERHGYRLLRSNHINEFLKYYFNEAYSEQTTTRILRWLMDEGVILRVRSDPDTTTVIQGSLCKIYGWNNRKNQSIDERHIKVSTIHTPREQGDTTTSGGGDEASKKQRDKTKIKRQDAYSLVPHELEIANSIVWGTVLPCRLSQGTMRFLDAPDILASRGSAEAKAAAKPYTWPVKVVYRNTIHKCSITPDRLFGIYFTALAQHWFFVLEEDRSSEAVQRDDFAFNAGTSLFRRFLTYAFLYHANVLSNLYNIKGFRILFVTDSQARINHVLDVWKRANDVLKEFKKQSGLESRGVPNNVLQCVARPTLRAGTIFTVPWVNGGGDEGTLDPPVAAPLLSAVR